MARTEGSELARGSKSQKARLSSDWSLQLDSMKLESLVIGDQHAPVNTFPGLVHTARHTMGVVFILRRDSNRKEESVYSGSDDWGEVVTTQIERWRYA